MCVVSQVDFTSLLCSASSAAFFVLFVLCPLFSKFLRFQAIVMQASEDGK